MRIVFMGANRTGWLCLSELLAMGQQVVGIFSTRSSFKISYSDRPVEVARHCSFEDLAREHQIPLLLVEERMGTYREQLAELRPDVVLVSGWYHLIPKRMLDIPPLGVIGFHPSLLPRYRGGAPLTWAILNGERETGMTMFYFDGGVDTGDLIAHERVLIADDDTIATLYEKVTDSTLRMIRELVPRLADGTAPRRSQDESQATYFPQRGPIDGLIDWSSSSSAIYDWIRAQTEPYPGAYTYFDGRRFTIWSAKLPEKPNNPVPGMAGYVLRRHRGQGVEVLTGDGSILLRDIELDGKRASADRVLKRTGLRLGLLTPHTAERLARLLEDG